MGLFSLLLYNIFAPLLWLKICNGDECLDLHSAFIVREWKRAKEVNERVWVVWLFEWSEKVSVSKHCGSETTACAAFHCCGIVPSEMDTVFGIWSGCVFVMLLLCRFSIMAYSVHWMNRVCLSRSPALSLFLLSFEFLSHYCVGCTAHSHFSVHLYWEWSDCEKKTFTHTYTCTRILFATIHRTPFNYHSMKCMFFSLVNTLSTVILWAFM